MGNNSNKITEKILNTGKQTFERDSKGYKYKVFDLEPVDAREIIREFQELQNYALFSARDSANFVLGSGFYTTKHAKVVTWAGDIPWLTLRNFEDHTNTYYLPKISIFKRSERFQACLFEMQGVDFQTEIPIQWHHDIENLDDHVVYSKIGDLVNELSTKDEKIVYSVSKKNKIENKKEIDLNKLIDQKWPHSYKILIKNQNKSFFCPSPERIVKRDKNYSYTESLAGIQALNPNGSQDAQQPIQENHVVLNFLLGKLKKKNYEPEVVKHLVQHGNLVHLKYNLKFKRCNFLKTLELLNEIYPTPTVCGSPQRWAYEKIQKLESPRGIYSGYFGGGVGKFFDIGLCLRGSVLFDTEIQSRAGASITTASYPQDEISEINEKLKNCWNFFNELPAEETSVNS